MNTDTHTEIDAPSRPRRLRAAMSLRRPSLRLQIVLILLGLLLVTFVAVSAISSFALRGFLVERLDQQLAAAGNRFSLSLEHPSDHDTDNTDQLNATQGQAVGTLGARILNGTVTAIAVIGHGAGESAVTTDDRKVLAALRPRSGARTVHFPDLGDYRLLVTPGDDGDVLITGLPEHPVDDTIARLLLIEASVFAACLLLAGAATTVSVRWSLRPLHRVASTAREVSNLPLSTGTVSLPDRVAIAAPQTEAGQVADAFNHMLEHVESALHDRHASEDRLRHFIADASHELRTPVAVIRSHAEYAERVGGPDLDTAVSEALARIAAESDRMGHLVEDLLLLARLDAGRPLEHAPVDLTRLVLDVVNDARVSGPEHHWRLVLPKAEVEVIGDAHALHQVLANLLTNARSHTAAGTTVRATLAASPPGQVVITVSDDGPGIPPDVLPRIFERFVRAPAARARPEGSGLGLSIVAAIVAAHDGTVHVTSRAGDTSFTIRLPTVYLGNDVSAGVH
ncbi:MAG: sensor histidine kinase [Jatrophihabitans sp.]